MNQKQIEARQQMTTFMKRCGIAPKHMDAVARVLLVATDTDGHLVAGKGVRQMLRDALGDETSGDAGSVSNDNG